MTQFSMADLKKKNAWYKIRILKHCYIESIFKSAVEIFSKFFVLGLFIYAHPTCMCPAGSLK